MSFIITKKVPYNKYPADEKKLWNYQQMTSYTLNFLSIHLYIKFCPSPVLGNTTLKEESKHLCNFARTERVLIHNF